MLLTSTYQILLKTQDHVVGTEASITVGTGGGKKHKSHSSTVTIFCPMGLQSLCFSSPCTGSESSSPYCSLFSRIYMAENYMSSIFLSLPPSYFHTQSSNPLLLSIYPECLQEAGDHICAASHTCSLHQALLRLMAKKVSIQGGR